MIVVRLQTVVSREVAPGDTAVVTVGSLQAGTRSNVIPDYAVLELNMRSYSAVTRQRMLDAIGRIVRAECQASGSPKDPGSPIKQAYLAAEKAGTLDDLPTNHSPAFLPPLQPTLRTGTEALVAGALAWLAPH